MAFVLAVCLSLVPMHARADRVLVDDPNDIGPASALDIRRASVDHGDRAFLHRIEMYASFTTADLDPGRASLGVAIDTDGNLRDLERIVFIIGGQRLRGVVTTGTGRGRIAAAPVRRLTGRAVEVSLRPDALPRDTTDYRWFAFAATEGQGGCCFDTAPNRHWVHHDIAPPAVEGPTFDISKQQAIPLTPVPVTFSVGDEGGSELGGWELLYRINETQGWTTAASGTTSGPQSATFPGDPGSAYDVCVRAHDKAGNVSADAFTHIEIPFDDTSPIFSYDASWTVDTSHPDDFMGTRHVTSTPGATVDIAVPAHTTVLLVVPPGYDGFAFTEIESPQVASSVWLAEVTSPRTIYDMRLSGMFGQPKVVHLQVESGTFAIDGFLGAAEHTPPPRDETHCL